MDADRRVLPAAGAETLLVAVALVGGLAAALFLLPLAEDGARTGPIAVVDASADGDDLVLAHRDGDTVPVSELTVVFDGPDGRQVRVPFDLGEPLDPDGRFGAGDRHRFTSPFLAEGVRDRLRHGPSEATLVDERLDFSTAESGASLSAARTRASGRRS